MDGPVPAAWSHDSGVTTGDSKPVHAQLPDQGGKCLDCRLAGIKILNLLYTVNIKMFKHPKYYKELRKRNKLDQVISDRSSRRWRERAPGPGLKQASFKQAASATRFAKNQFKVQGREKRHKPQAPSSKPQASSRKLQAQRF